MGKDGRDSSEVDADEVARRLRKQNIISGSPPFLLFRPAFLLGLPFSCFLGGFCVDAFETGYSLAGMIRAHM